MVSAKDFGLQVTGGSGDEEYVLCPWHSDHSSSASFNRKKGLFYCYVCNLGLNTVQLQKELGTDLELEPDWSGKMPDDYDLLEETKTFELGEELYAPYFADRKIPHRTIMRYQVRWSESQGAAVLPLTSLRGKVQGVAYRFLEGTTRYLVQGKPTPVWPMPLLVGIPRGTPLLVTEGAWSAMRLAAFFEFEPFLALALLGAKANDAIVNTLRSFRVTFLYDGDRAGERACRKMRRLFPTANSWTLSTSPDDMTKDQLVDLFQKLEEKGAIGEPKR